jgi:hypothetical protein
LIAGGTMDIGTGGAVTIRIGIVDGTGVGDAVLAEGGRCGVAERR